MTERHLFDPSLGFCLRCLRDEREFASEPCYTDAEWQWIVAQAVRRLSGDGDGELTRATEEEK